MPWPKDRLLFGWPLSDNRIVKWSGTRADYDQGKTVSLPPEFSDIYQPSESTNLLCAPQYGLQTVEVTYTTNNATGACEVYVPPLNSSEIRPLEAIQSSALSKAIMDSVAASGDAMSILYPNPNAAYLIVNDPSEGQGGFFPTQSDAFFTTMTMRYPPADGTIRSTWFDPQLLQERSVSFFGSVAAQFASQYIQQESNATVPGIVTTTKPRLVVSPAVFYTIEALLILCLSGALALAWSATKYITPIDPASIGGTVTTLLSDDTLMK